MGAAFNIQAIFLLSCLIFVSSSLQLQGGRGFVIVFRKIANKITKNQKITEEIVYLPEGRSLSQFAEQIRNEKNNKPNTKVISVLSFRIVKGIPQPDDFYAENVSLRLENQVLQIKYEKLLKNHRECRKELGYTNDVLNETLDKGMETNHNYEQKITDFEEQIKEKLDELESLQKEKQTVEDNYKNEVSAHSTTQQQLEDSRADFESLQNLHSQAMQNLGSTKARLEAADKSRERRGLVIETREKEKEHLTTQLAEVERQFQQATAKSNELADNVNQFSVELQLKQKDIEHDQVLKHKLRQDLAELAAKLGHVENQNGLHKATINSLEHLKDMLNQKVHNHELTEMRFSEMNKGLESKLAHLETANALLDKSLHDYESRLITEISSKDSIKASLHELKESKARLEEEMRNVRETKTQFQVENVHLTAAKDSLDKDKQALALQIATLTAQNQAYQKATADLKADNAKHNLNDELKTMELANRAKEEARLTQQIAELVRQQAVQQEQVSHLTHNNRELNKSLDKLNTEIAQIKSSEAELEKRIATLNESIAGHRGNQEAQKLLIAELREAESGLEKTRKSLQDKIEELGKGNAEKDAIIAKKREKSKHWKSVAQTAKEQKENLERDLLNIKLSFDSAIAENKKLGNEMGQLKIAVEVVKGDLSTEKALKAQLDKELEKLAANMAQVNQQNSSQQKELQTLSEIKNSLSAQVEHHKMSESQFNGVKAEMNAQLASLNQQKADLAEGIAKMEQEKRHTQAEKEALQTQLNAARVEQASLNTELKQVHLASTEFNLRHSKLESAHEEMVKDSHVLKEQIAKLEQESKHLANQNFALDKSFANKQTDNLHLEERIKDHLVAEGKLRETIISLESQKLVLDSKLANVNEQNGRLEENKDALHKQVASLESTQLKMERQIDTLRHESHKHQGDKDVFRQNINDLELARNSLQLNKEQLESTIAALEQRNAVLDSDNTNLKHNNQQLQKSVSVMDQEKRDLLSEFTKLKTMYENGHAERTDLNKQLGEVTTRMLMISESHNESKAYGNLLQDQLTSLREVIKKAEESQVEQKANIHNLTTENGKLVSKAAKQKLKKQNLKKVQQELNQEIVNLKKGNEQAAAQEKALQVQIFQGEGDKSRLQGQLEKVEAHKHDLEAKLVDAEQRMSDFLVQNTSLASEVKSLRKAENELQDSIKLLERTIEDKKHSVEQLKKEIEKHTGDNEEQNKKINEKAEEIVVLNAEVASLMTQKLKLGDQVLYLTGENKDLIDAQNEANNEAKKVSEVNQLLHTQIQKLNLQIQTHQENKAELEQEMKSLQEGQKVNLETIDNLNELKNNFFNKQHNDAQTIDVLKKRVQKKEQEAEKKINEHVQTISELEQIRLSLNEQLKKGENEYHILLAQHNSNQAQKKQEELRKNEEGYVVLEIGNLLAQLNNNPKDPAGVEQRKKDSLQILQTVKDFVDKLAQEEKAAAGSYTSNFLRRFKNAAFMVKEKALGSANSSSEEYERSEDVSTENHKFHSADKSNPNFVSFEYSDHASALNQVEV